MHAEGRCIFSNVRQITTCELRDGAPGSESVVGNVAHELLVLLRRPQPSPQLLLVAARLLRHARQQRYELREEGEGEEVQYKSRRGRGGSLSGRCRYVQCVASYSLHFTSGAQQRACAHARLHSCGLLVEGGGV
jgi:hypothetical protein